MATLKPEDYLKELDALTGHWVRLVKDNYKVEVRHDGLTSVEFPE
jgi:hypothetical protein